jgi:hypothetical protein
MKKGESKNGAQLLTSWKVATTLRAVMANSVDNVITIILKMGSLSRNGPERKNSYLYSYTRNTETAGLIFRSSSRAGTYIAMQDLELCKKHALL